jgi:ABC-type multidrug transport system fused ATPase/permease subunit
MNATLAAAIIFVVFAVGDMISAKTKAIVSMLLVASVVFLLGFWAGIFPTTMFADSTLLSMAGLLVTLLLVHLGTTIKLRDFGAQWRTVIISAVACIAISVAVFFIGQLIIDRGFALVGAPILSGGVVATLQMQSMAQDAGREELAVFATLVMCAQGFVGYPVASLCLKSEAKRIKAKLNSGELSASDLEASKAAEGSHKKLIPPLPAALNTPNAILAKVVLVALLSVTVSGLFHDAVNKLVWCLIFGVLCKEIGFLDENALGKANATGIVMPIITLSIFTNLASATPQMVGSMIVPLLVVIVIGSIAFSVVSILVGKIFGYSWQMSMAIGSSCLFGFPGTVIISNEVSESTGTTAEEKAFINEQIMPKMLVAGMVTVSITSVLVAGVMCKWL